MVACATEVTARPGAKCFDRPLRDGHLFLHHFPALRTGLLSLSPSGTSLRRILLIPMLTRMSGCRTSTEDGARALRLSILRTTPRRRSLGVKSDDSFKEKPRADQRTKQSHEPKPFSLGQH